jgi:hypothetical protein
MGFCYAWCVGTLPPSLNDTEERVPLARVLDIHSPQLSLVLNIPVLIKKILNNAVVFSQYLIIGGTKCGQSFVKINTFVYKNPLHRYK